MYVIFCILCKLSDDIRESMKICPPDHVLVFLPHLHLILDSGAQSDTWLFTSWMKYSHAVWPCVATWPRMFLNTHVLRLQHWRRWKTQPNENDLRLALLNTEILLSCCYMHFLRATLHCAVQPFLKPQDFCYSIFLIKRLHCQDAFVLQTLISKRSLAREQLALYFILWIL